MTDPPEVHADWLEWRSLVAPEHYVSWSDHQRDLRIGGGDESLADDDNLEVLTVEIAAEIERRIEACGSRENSYPFDVTDQGLRQLSDHDATAYTFQLLLTLFGRHAGPPDTYGDRLFEDLCAEALFKYLGGTSEGFEVVVFGFPRRVLPSGFKQAVDELCRKMREGRCAQSAPETEDQKDAHLDLVAWKGFPESKPGQLIVFGQCSTGMDWFDKIHELQPGKWCQLWLKEQPLVPPVPSFFVPRLIEPLQWRRAGVYGGILFDRCRISWLLPTLSKHLIEGLRRWIDYVLAREPGL